MKLRHSNKPLFLRSINQAFLTAMLLIVCFTAYAQPGCPAISVAHNGTTIANRDTLQLPCGTSSANLTAIPFDAGATSSYGVSQITYNPFSYTTGTDVLVHTDDLWSAIINLPFKFCFFDTAYTRLIIGSNGNISFNTVNHGAYNPWPISNPIPTAADISSEINNGVMGPWEDIDPTHQGNIYYQIIGAAPCRMFVVSWDRCGYYGDPNSNCASCDTDVALFGTSQIVLYETTNVIEIYIQTKDVLHAWNGGKAVEGIENNSATVAYTVPGRNATEWTATNDAWRFTPNGPSIVSVSWYNGTTQISTDSVVQVSPSTATTYIAEAVYVPCSGGVNDTVSDTITVALSGTLNAGLVSTVNVTCFGLNNGSASALVSGGTLPVTYGWSTGSTALSVSNLSPGIYSFSAGDGSGCVRSDTFVITQPNPVGISGNLTNPACHGSCNGMVATIDTGGSGGPYTYLWNTTPVQTVQTAINLCAGAYNVTVSDANSCSASASFILTEPAASAINQVSITNVTCIGGSNGSVTVSAGAGFNGTVSFQWSNGEVGAQDTALTAGNYAVTATDSLGCSASAAYTITQPANGINLQAPTITNVVCYGNTNGVIVANASGGAGLLTYTWTNLTAGTQLSGQAINNLSAGTYQLTVTDANGCTDTTSYAVTTPAQLVIDSITHNDVICAGTNGQAQVFAHGGTGAYTYGWSSNSSVTTSSITGLPGGLYSVTVTDASGCSVSAQFNIFEATPISVTSINITDVACAGQNNGSVAITATGGIPPYQFIWSNGTTGATDSNLSMGIYYLSITDSNSCTLMVDYTISQPGPLLSGTPDILNIGCSGGTTGSITANPSGGTQPYFYSWVQQSNGQTYNTQTINNLSADNYLLMVTDAHGCSITASYTISAVPQLSYTYDSVNVLCANGNNGSVSVSILSGRPPYTFMWDNTASTDSVYNNLQAGPVDVKVIDSDNCRGESLVNITQPQPLVIHQLNLGEISCSGGNNGYVSASVTGGTPGYVFRWNNLQTGPIDSGLTAGNYNLTVTDTNLCTVTQSFLLTQPDPLVSAPVSQSAKCFSSTDGSIDANPSGGTAPYTFAWSNGATTQVDGNLALGSYSCTIEDALGCMLTISDSVGQPSQIHVTDSATAVKCVGQYSGTAFVFPTGGVPPYDYSATQDSVNFINATNGILEGLDTGYYNIRVTDSVGCIVQTSVYIKPATPDSFSTQVDSTLCYGPEYSDGAALVTPYTTQNGPYTYLLDGYILQDTGYFQKLSAGLHTIIATNANGCMDTLTVVVPQPLPIVIDITPDNVTLPLGGSESVLVTTQNTTNPTYNWTPSLGLSCVDCPNPVVSPYTPGQYMLVVSVENGPATCYDTAYLSVFILSHHTAFFPNAFSPNGDGNNDQFLIYGEDIKTVSLKIFNRWGEKVYETTNPMAGWDGTYKGMMQNVGVFTYEAVVTFLDDTQQTKNGTVTLLR
jgi:gliding motility-associated-like protein